MVLALLVALSHLSVTVNGYNPGIVAVISFLMLSGYVMVVLIEKHYTTLARIPSFYLDRAARLYPQFIFYLTAEIILIWATQMNNGWCPGTPYAIPIRDTVLTYLMAPLGYWFFLDFKCQLMPQAWSLGLELTFYAVVPFIVLYTPRPVTIALYVGSLAMSVIACNGYLNTDVYGYRLLPGTLFLFLTGMAFADPRRFPSWIPGTTFAFAAVMYAWTLEHPDDLYKWLYNKEVYLGAMIGVVALWMLRHKRFSRVDEFLGNLSYGVFLNHFFVIWAAWQIVWRWGFVYASWQFNVIALIGCVVCAALTYYAIERPALMMRRRLRKPVPTTEPMPCTQKQPA